MQKKFSIFYSRTFWTLVAIFVVNGGNAIDPMLPPAAQALVTLGLSVLATYFHTNPSQQYNQPTQ